MKPFQNLQVDFIWNNTHSAHQTTW